MVRVLCKQTAIVQLVLDHQQPIQPLYKMHGFSSFHTSEATKKAKLVLRGDQTAVNAVQGEREAAVGVI